MNTEIFEEAKNEDGLLSVAQYAKKHNISKARVYVKIHKKKIPWNKIYVIKKDVLRIDDN